MSVSRKRFFFYTCTATNPRCSERVKENSVQHALSYCHPRRTNKVRCEAGVKLQAARCVFSKRGNKSKKWYFVPEASLRVSSFLARLWHKLLVLGLFTVGEEPQRSTFLRFVWGRNSLFPLHEKSFKRETFIVDAEVLGCPFCGRIIKVSVKCPFFFPGFHQTSSVRTNLYCFYSFMSCN